jgi:NarL family two-component system response regulator LiaR
MKKTRILIADDHSLVRSGLKMLFRSSADFAVVAEASDGDEAIELTGKHKPDIAILDISMPGVNGIEAAAIIRKKHPETRVLILTIHHDEEYVYQMVRVGANGYVLKDAGKKELFAAVRAVEAGDRFFSPGISKLMIDQFIKRAKSQEVSDASTKSVLTNRETEILRYIAEGFSNPEIARKLFLSVRTVDTHRTNMMFKLDIHDTAGLVRYAIEKGIVKTSLNS